MKIKSVRAYEIIASGGYPTVEAVVETENGSVGVASVPYGASAGSHEAVILEDGDSSRYDGHGMLEAVSNIETKIAPELVGQMVENQPHLDEIMLNLDDTIDKSNLGGNAILGISLAFARAAAAEQKVELYKYFGNL